MRPQVLKTQKLTQCKWLNLFERKVLDRKGKEMHWEFASRKENPDEKKLDVVCVVATIEDREDRGYTETLIDKKLILVKHEQQLSQNSSREAAVLSKPRASKCEPRERLCRPGYGASTSPRPSWPVCRQVEI